MSLKGGVLLCWIVTWFGSVTSDPFYCDDDIVPGIEPLPSYIYHCDGVSQCIDGRDERGCSDCPSGKLLLVGVEPRSSLFQYETVFQLQDYKLRNRPVYKTTDDSLRQGYVSYNDLESRWEVSQYADQGIFLVSSPTIASQPFLDQVTWRQGESRDTVPGLRFQCVPEDTRKCYGNILVVSPKEVLKLDLTEDLFNERVRYESESFELQFVLFSDTWATPHWQVVNKDTSEEEIVFLRSTALHPEYITTPGLYKTADSTWVKSSNVYVKCEVLTSAPDYEPHSLDCQFLTDTCGWSVRLPGDMGLSGGAVEQYSPGTRAPPSLHIALGKGTPSGKYRLTSPKFGMDSDSCLLLKFASTITAPDSDPTLSIVLKDLYDSVTVFEKSTCTNPNKKHCSRVDQYPTQLIDLSLGDGGPKTNAQIVITIELQTSEQPSGVVALVETALIEGPCEDSTLEMIDPCYDMDFPCNSDYCVQSGYKGYECQCEDSAMYGAHCDETKDEECTVGDVTIDHAEEVVSLAGYRGSDILMVQCLEGYELKGDLPRCQRDREYSTLPECVKIQCPTIDLPHATVTVVSPTLTTVQCDEGFLPADLQTLHCEGGRYNSSFSSCLLECPADPQLVFSGGKENESESDSPPITVEVSLCDFSTGPSHTNYTRCKESSSTLGVPGSLSVAPDLSLSVNTRGELCVNFAESASGGTVQCSVQCVESSVIEFVREVDSREQYVKVVTNFDYSSEKLVNSVRSRNSLIALLFGAYFMLIS